MKRVNGLWEQVISLENLQLADEKARKGKLKSYGVRRHDRNRKRNLIRLNRWLKNGTFRTSTYDIFTIFTPKERLIYRLPYFPDRIVHHALMNVLEPIWVKVFITQSYSCIKGRGIHKAAIDLKRTLTIDEEGTKYCLKLDIRKFYPSIDHDIMKAIVRRKIKDEKVLALIEEIIDSADGVPIGNYLSQYLANLYLSYFDQWAKNSLRIKHYFRYADDIVILSDSKQYLHEVFNQFESYLNQNLKLEIKGNWQVFPVDVRGIDFVGYVFRHTHVLLRKSIKKNYIKHVVKYSKKGIEQRQYDIKMAAWKGWLMYCNSRNLTNKIKEYEIQLRYAS